MANSATDWGVVSPYFDALKADVDSRDLASANEAQTRFDVIDRMIKEVLGWKYGAVAVEEYAPTSEKAGFIDYMLRSGDVSIVVEAKKIGAAFPTPTINKRLKIDGSVLGIGEVARAIEQAKQYAVTKGAQVAVVTNGMCWCFFNVVDLTADGYATLLFPFSKDGHTEELFDFLASENVAGGSVSRITNDLPPPEERLLDAFKSADDRVDRNNIADQIAPALDGAMYSESILHNPDALRRCFVTTEARTKFDAMLGMHLADPRPAAVTPAKRINRGKRGDHLENLIANGAPSYAPPVTLIIGPVGAGKSTYLKHFELVSGSAALAAKSAHWIYVDMEGVGKSGNPRQFVYSKLKSYLDERGSQKSKAELKAELEAAYKVEIEALQRGPLSFLEADDPQIARDISQYLVSEFKAVEPYVDKLLGHIAKQSLAVVVLDNVDLYEDDSLETAVFAEGLAISKRIHCHVIVSIRDTTFVRHRNDSAFDAYELRKLWLDPPPLKAVISARLSYSKKILERKSAQIELPNNKRLHVPDLSVFFDIVQQSILRGHAGDYVEAIADLNTRKGLTLVKNFLTSGHIEADRALSQYLTGNTSYYFPFHEIFKGTMLGQWRLFKESRSEGVNIFDSRLGSRRLRMLRAFILQFLLHRAKAERSMEVTVDECCEVICQIGATRRQVEDCLSFLQKNGLVRTMDSDVLTPNSTIVASRSGGYYVRMLARKFVYVEECMYDTAIDSAEAWQRIRDLTASIVVQSNSLTRMYDRRTRMMLFLDNLSQIEDDVVADVPILRGMSTIAGVRNAVLDDIDGAIRKIRGTAPGPAKRFSK